METLVIGANGLIGSVVVDSLRRQRSDVVGTYHSEPPEFDVPLVQLDVADTETAAGLVDDHDVDTVINCAAFTDVDGCEGDPELAEEVNGSAPGRLAGLCADRDISFVHFSTDYVFDGRSNESYSEDAPTNPVQAYGASKLSGERAVLAADPDALVLRLSFVYGARGDTGELVGFPQWVAETLRAGEEAPLFTDQHLTPSRAGNVAETTHSLSESGSSGVFHVASRSCVTPYEFGGEICELVGGDETLLAQSSMADLDRAAERPRNSCLNVSKVEDTLGRPQPTLAEDLDALDAAFEDYSS
jgi:dTDP-4-dehydrorhamnose reductase